MSLAIHWSGVLALHLIIMRTALTAAKILYRAGKAAYKARKGAASTAVKRSASRIVVSRAIPRGSYKTVKFETTELLAHIFTGSA